jgi:preprotein translocase subunit SecA
MTGTADTEAAEFHKIYKLDVVVIPTNKPIKRKDHDDLVYKTEREKFKAVVEEIKERTSGAARARGHDQRREVRGAGEPARKKGIPHNVLNAKQHEREAYVVAQAGRKGAVTVATNMAGRGTDILLGGNPEMLGARWTRHAERLAPKPAPSEPRVPLLRQGALDSADEAQEEVRGHLREDNQKEVIARGWLPHHRHRAPRVAPHRQPAARSRGPSGRPRLVALLSVARRRPHADLRW